MKNKIFTLMALAAACSSILAGCGSSNASYKDGVYTAQSSVYEGDELSDEEADDAGNGYGVVTITIEDGIISDCSFVTYEVDGTLKDESYGMEDGRIANKDYYNKAQKANAACQEYADMLVASGRLDDVDAISGATINYNEFVEAVENALEEAEE